MNVHHADLGLGKVEVDQDSIALCLSGGGLRAMLFHIGLLRALRQARFKGQMALAAVREVYAVSGGSILAAHFLANYDRYISEDDAVFISVEKDLLSLADRDMRNRILRRWPFLFFLQNPRGHILQAEYHRFLGKKTIGQCYGNKQGLPTFHFLATSFTNGALCSFSRTLFEQVDPSNTTITSSTAADGLPLAFAVAASSAFPPMFPPIRLTPELLGTGGTPPFNTTIALSDGGVYDNFGIDKFCLSQRTGARPGMLIVSNAGGSFATDPAHSYSGMVSRNTRASDILMRRVAETTLQSGEGVAGSGLALVRIGQTVPDSNLPETTQQRFRLVRTDLDQFDHRIATLLIEHGERIGRAVLSKHHLETAGPELFAFDPPAPKGEVFAYSADQARAIDKKLSGAAQRRFRNLFFDFRDFIFTTVWWLIGLAVLAALITVILGAVAFKQAKRDAEEQAQSLQTAVASSKYTLEAVREAAARDDLDGIKKTLAIAIQTNKAIGASAQVADPKVPTVTSQAQVDTIIGTPVATLLPKVNYAQKVYIQFAGALTRQQITDLNQMLRQAGWAAQGPSGERTGQAAGKAEVRYAGDNLPAAQALADALNRSGLRIAKVKPRFNPDIGANLEAWISN